MTPVNVYVVQSADVPYMPERNAMIEYKCKDDPETLGRVPSKGEQRFTLIFPLETGEELRLHLGRESMNHFETFIAQMMVDDEAERESSI